MQLRNVIILWDLKVKLLITLITLAATKQEPEQMIDVVNNPKPTMTNHTGRIRNISTPRPPYFS